MKRLRLLIVPAYALADLSCPAALKVFTPEVATGQSSGIPLPFFVRSSRWSVV
jgi:hypothetical protein